MNYTHYTNEMPDLNMSYEELKNIIQRLMGKISSSFDFNSFTNRLSKHLIETGKGFVIKPNTEYSGDMKQQDKTVVREIIWDLIIDRYISLGGNGHDEWPSLTITARGQIFFSAFK
jgi:hypothetical protein